MYQQALQSKKQNYKPKLQNNGGIKIYKISFPNFNFWEKIAEI